MIFVLYVTDHYIPLFLMYNGHSNFILESEILLCRAAMHDGSIRNCTDRHCIH